MTDQPSAATGRGPLAPRVVLPLLILLLAVAATAAMILLRKPVTRKAPRPLAPLVRVQVVRPAPATMVVRTEGTVEPRTESTLVAEVGGRLIFVAPELAAGSFFVKDAVLARIDPADYVGALAQAEAAVSQAEVRLAREEADARLALEEWEAGEGGPAPPLVSHELQLREARAALAAAEAVRDQARRNLERTTLRAPFDGRVRAQLVDRGQYLPPGTPLARIYATDWVEIPLPLGEDEAGFVDLPLAPRPGRSPRPEVRITSRFGGQRHVWRGRIVRIDGAVDPRTRMIRAIARVEDPYGRNSGAQRPPLTPGSFVEAEIVGKRLPRLMAIPREALREGDVVLVVDDEQRLHRRPVDIYRLDGETAWIVGGLEDGERVCLTPLSRVVDGMRVRPFPQEPSDEAITP
ncbi:MAG: efflux RND transporter periplasmic adaptor subunit [Acidobacteriota bacterium]|nr:efflux RND transporter periplasmic adaptor subunit [Acidobacteriota bacterium]MDQ7088709.1 efflux RND transporter periplasmic adaptor subunit [Acidobacteriota bacterium]